LARPCFSRRTKAIVSTLAVSLVLTAGLIVPAAVVAEANDSASARSGVEIAAAAANAWAADAQLIYLENDEPVDAGGRTERWGYLYYSPSLDRSRGYSVGRGKVLQATDLGMRFDAPLVSGNWLDSSNALQLAEEKAGAEFRSEHGGELQSMVLMRSVIELDEPDRTNWMVIYSAEGVPSLFVVIDAISGKVSRTWRG